MSLRRNKSTVLKCLVIAIIVLVTVPLLLPLFRPSPSSRNNHNNNNNNANDVAAIDGESGKVLKPPGQRQRRRDDDAHDGPPRLIDWHDNDAISREKERKGPGEGGSAHSLSAEEEKLKSPLYQGEGSNYGN